ncbi:phage replisome organizer N-terminal domain-containing protein [Brachyspira catarrhinii]|uniref:Phage replisome organiser N-terminal domain-containing protein n=1 Tax=Brachyspira catarrhinii TaxID=2528966 RepID=A0ABY2TPZ9_9SPIR|nr:phage replisome organizer N-terminal domain-containing protein [Brachyspira catarrhinii]TKZ29039.1 hypothetical protein EZH24_11345 [Brachyspira catarrhinii]
MAENKKYYYLKLKDTFFDSEEMKILESMDNGILYQNLYLKICLISLKSNGALLFKDMIPYNIDMIATITRINKDIVKSGLNVFKQLGLITIADNETIYMSDIQTLIGKASTESDRVSKYKKKLDTIKIEEEASNNYENDCSNFVEEQEENCNNYVEKLQKNYASVTPEREIEKELESEKEREKENPPPSSDFDLFVRELCVVFETFTAKTATSLCQIDGYKTPQKQAELKASFEARRYDWVSCVKLAKKTVESKSRQDLSTRWLDFLSYLRIFLKNGDEKNNSIKRHYTAEELAQREIKRQQLELEKKQRELEEERRQKEIDRQEAEKLGMTLEEYYDYWEQEGRKAQKELLNTGFGKKIYEIFHNEESE